MELWGDSPHPTKEKLPPEYTVTQLLKMYVEAKLMVFFQWLCHFPLPFFLKLSPLHELGVLPFF